MAAAEKKKQKEEQERDKDRGKRREKEKRMGITEKQRIDADSNIFARWVSQKERIRH